ncbi:MAG: hypothetical protein LBE79_12690 [Tannerella sp.]|jgi:hypothetical protein|nr:hypothetical protein [Tannerella sp.]
MKKIIYILPFILLSQLNAQSSDPEALKASSLNNRKALTQPVPANIQKYFDIAINEIEQMLKGEKPLSFKRAVYLVENAYFEGQICWDEYNNEILRIVPILNKMIDNRGIRGHKTAGNWAIFTFMSDRIPENNNNPYQYDFENFMCDTHIESGMVSRLLKTKKGTCRSLPYFYKILADEMGAEAHIALAPMHVYVKHRDEQGNWWNLEMTTGSFSRSSFIMENFNVSEAAVRSGLFMKSLSDIESVAQCINDLLVFYERKTGRYSDDFVKKCYEIGLQYFPVSLLQLVKVNDLKFRLDNKMTDMGMNNYWQIINHPELLKEFEIMHSVSEYLSEIGFTTISPEDYDRLVTELRRLQNKSESNK